MILLLLGGCGVARLTAELPAGEHPEVDFQSNEISAARAAKVSELGAQLALVEGRFGARYVGLPGRRDRCEEGQDNFTRQDRWAYTCRIAITRVLPIGDPFRESASSLGEALLEGDCPDGTDTDRELGRFSGDPQDLNASSGDCTPGPSPPVRPRSPAGSRPVRRRRSSNAPKSGSPIAATERTHTASAYHSTYALPSRQLRPTRRGWPSSPPTTRTTRSPGTAPGPHRGSRTAARVAAPASASLCATRRALNGSLATGSPNA